MDACGVVFANEGEDGGRGSGGGGCGSVATEEDGSDGEGEKEGEGEGGGWEDGGDASTLERVEREERGVLALLRCLLVLK